MSLNLILAFLCFVIFMSWAVNFKKKTKNFFKLRSWSVMYFSSTVCCMGQWGQAFCCWLPQWKDPFGNNWGIWQWATYCDINLPGLFAKRNDNNFNYILKAKNCLNRSLFSPCRTVWVHLNGTPQDTCCSVWGSQRLWRYWDATRAPGWPFTLLSTQALLTSLNGARFLDLPLILGSWWLCES